MNIDQKQNMFSLLFVKGHKKYNTANKNANKPTEQPFKNYGQCVAQ